jgi:hypothetical protein
VNGVWASEDKTMFEVTGKGTTVDFEKFADGSFYIGVDGYQRETFRMTTEQFAAFKDWIVNHC